MDIVGGCAVKLNKTFQLIFWILDGLVGALVANYKQDDIETKLLVPLKEPIYQLNVIRSCLSGFCMFYYFDFSLLNSKWVKEDTIRGELISPLLKALGYSLSGNHRIIRSFALPHPYIYIGTKKNNIKITHDYLLIIDEKHK